MRIFSLVISSFLVALVSISYASACGSKRYCKQMANCAEATYYYRECGLDRLDRDKDGIPCETKCGKTRSVHERRLAVQTSGKTLMLMFGSASGSTALTDTSADPAGYTCSVRKRFCKEMDTCDEATFYLKKCGVAGLDGNRDGIPCNSLCR